MPNTCSCRALLQCGGVADTLPCHHARLPTSSSTAGKCPADDEPVTQPPCPDKSFAWHAISTSLACEDNWNYPRPKRMLYFEEETSLDCCKKVRLYQKTANVHVHGVFMRRSICKLPVLRGNVQCAVRSAQGRAQWVGGQHVARAAVVPCPSSSCPGVLSSAPHLAGGRAAPSWTCY